MKKVSIEFSGIIEFTYTGSFETIKLAQADGYKIDLIGRFKEASESYIGASVQMSYYISDKPCTKNEMVEGWLAYISGGIQAEFEANEYAYSSWTSGTDYDTTFTVGGHNMMNELRSHAGKFIIIELKFN